MVPAGSATWIPLDQAAALADLGFEPSYNGNLNRDDTSDISHGAPFFGQKP